jgi:type III secretion protein T
MGPELTEFIGQLYLSAQMLVIAAARSLGFAVFFTPFVWSHMNSGLLRIAFGVALALPVMHPIWGEAPQMVQKLPAPVVIIVAKEIFIGMLLGLAASLPFEAIGAAGSFVDSQRNASTPIPSPAGELTPIGQIFMVAGLWLFATLGGFWMIVDAIFQSYRVWPPLALMPPLTMDGAMAIPALLSRLIMTAIVFSAPLVIVLVATDIILGIAGKLGKRVDVTFLTLSVKNLVAIILLPFVMLGFVRAFTGEINGLGQIVQIIETVVR